MVNVLQIDRGHLVVGVFEERQKLVASSLMLVSVHAIEARSWMFETSDAMALTAAKVQPVKLPIAFAASTLLAPVTSRLRDDRR